MLLVSVMAISTVWSMPFSLEPVQSVVLVIPANDISEPIQLDDMQFETMHQRHKRSYDQYYFYPSSLNPPEQEIYGSASHTRSGSRSGSRGGGSYINRREAIDPNQIDGPNGKKYKYTPLFQYKSTQSRHRKLFVPNLFG